MSPRRPSPGSLARTVKLINRDVVASAFANLHPARYYIREAGGRDSVSGLCLRVGATSVAFGHRRAGPFVAIFQAHRDMTPAEIDGARREVREALRELEEKPAAAHTRQRLTVRDLGDLYLQDLEATRGDRRSPRTLESYRDLWRVHLVPLIGDLPVGEVTPDVVGMVKLEIPRRVQARMAGPDSGAEAEQTRPIAAKSGGRTVANRAMQQAEAAWSFAVRREWVTRNPWSEAVVDRYEEQPDDHVLDAAAYAALGRALRESEAALQRPRPPLPMRSIAAVRVLLLTGARAGEVTPAKVTAAAGEHVADLEADFPAIHVPRAKGDRGGTKRPLGRTVYLPPEAVAAIRAVPRFGSPFAFPGDLPNEPIRRLEKTWASLLRSAGLPHVPLKTTRPSWRTHAADAGLPPEHVQLLMGHAGLKITDTTYLKRLAPSLYASACKVGTYIAGLLGDKPTEGADVLPFRGKENR